MAKELPFLKFNPTEWLAGRISFQPLEVQGAFMQCICVAWTKGGSFKFEDIEYRVEANAWQKLVLLKFVKQDENGCFSIDFLNELILEINRISEVRKYAGSQGGRSKSKQTKAKSSKTSIKNKNKEEDIYKGNNPTLEDVKSYFDEKGYKEESAIKFFEYYDEGGWKDSKGNKVRSWKQKAQAVWFKPENLKQTNEIKPIKQIKDWY